MEELGFEQVMAELDNFFGPSPLSSSPVAPQGTTNQHIGLKRDSDGDAMLLDAPPPAAEMPSLTEDLPNGGLRKSPEFAELLENPWMDHPRELMEPESTNALQNTIEEDMSESSSSRQTPPLPDFGLLIHTTPPPSDVEHLEPITHGAETSAPPQILQDLPTVVADPQDVPGVTRSEPEVEQDMSAVVPQDELVDATQVGTAEPSASPLSPPASHEDQQAPAFTDEVQGSPGAAMPMELELPIMEQQRAPPELEHESQETPAIPSPNNMELRDQDEQAQLTDYQAAGYSTSEPQLPTYVPSNMMLQAMSEVLPQQTTPLPPSSVHRSELHAEMRAEEDAADTAISPEPVSTFSDRLHSTPAQPADNISSSDYSLDQYGNIVFEDEDSDEEVGTDQPKPEETSPEDSAVEVVKAPSKKRVQPRKIKIDADKPHWAQLKKPVSKKPPPRVKKVPVKKTLPSPSPPLSAGFRFPPEMPQRNVSTRASAATKAEARSTQGIQQEETSSSELSSLRSPPPPVAGGFRMPNGHTMAPPPLQYTRAPSTRLQAQQKPKPQPAKKRKPHQNLLASMVPPEFDNTGGSFVTSAEQDIETNMNGEDGSKASKKRAHSEDEVVYDEEGYIVTSPAKTPAPPPKRVRTTTKPKAPPKPPMNKELMSIVGATVMADMHPNSPRKTRNQQRELDAIAPNASAAAKRRHTKQGKLIAG